MGLFDFLTGGGKRRRRVQTSARPGRRRRSRRGERAQAYYERVEQLRTPRRRAAPARPARGDVDRTAPTVEIPRSVQREAERRWRERERAEQQQRDQERREAVQRARREAKAMERLERDRKRAIEAYMTHGLTRAEAEDMVNRQAEFEDERNWNPRRRRRRRNPSLAEFAVAIVQGAATAAAQEEAKELRDHLHKARGSLKGALRSHKTLGRAVSAVRAPWDDPELQTRRRRNPARLEPNHPDPKLRAMSERFHGYPGAIVHLDPDQRRPPPTHAVVIGQERAITYRTPRRSERAGADWEHQSGDAGPLRRNVAGRRLLVADEHGNVYVVRGSSGMRFDPDRGLVG